jgi:hypothetical protein
MLFKKFLSFNFAIKAKTKNSKIMWPISVGIAPLAILFFVSFKLKEKV